MYIFECKMCIYEEISLRTFMNHNSIIQKGIHVGSKCVTTNLTNIDLLLPWSSKCIDVSSRSIKNLEVSLVNHSPHKW